MKISEYPQWYWHLPVRNQCWVASNQILDRVTSALKWWDLWPVYESKEDPSQKWVVSVWWDVYIIWNWQSWIHKCPN